MLTRCTGQVVEREGPLREAQALLRRLRERDLYKFVDSVQVPVEVLRENMCVLPRTWFLQSLMVVFNCTCALTLSCGAEFVAFKAVLPKA